MKKILLYAMALMTMFSFYACTDDSMGTEANRDKLFRPTFRCDNNTGKGDKDSYNCTVTDLNSVHLYWYTVDDAVGYEVKWAISSYVSNGEQAWIEAENGVNGKELAGHESIKDPKQFDMLIEHLSYQTDYRFAIRALHSFDLNDPKNSDWYGYGNGREWADWFGLQTGARYEVPFVIQVSDITKNSMKVRLNSSIAGSDNDTKVDKDGNVTHEQPRPTFREHFHFLDADQNRLMFDYLTFTASKSTPDATVNPT